YDAFERGSGWPGRSDAQRFGGARAREANGAVHGGFEALHAERLQEVVDGLAFEGFQRIFATGSDEDDEWASCQSGHHFEAIHFGHLDVEQKDVNRTARGLRILDRAEGFRAACTARNDFDSRIAFEHAAETFAC